MPQKFSWLIWKAPFAVNEEPFLLCANTWSSLIMWQLLCLLWWRFYFLSLKFIFVFLWRGAASLVPCPVSFAIFQVRLNPGWSWLPGRVLTRRCLQSLSLVPCLPWTSTNRSLVISWYFLEIFNAIIYSTLHVVSWHLHWCLVSFCNLDPYF